MLCCPASRRQAGVECRWKCMFRCEAVVHGGNDAARAVTQRLAECVVGGEIGKHKATAMKVDQQREPPCALRYEDTHWQIAGRTGNSAIDDAGDRRGWNSRFG